MWNPRWLQSLIPRLQSLLSQSLSRLRPPCPRRWLTPQHQPSQPRSEEAARPAAKTSRSPRRRCRPKKPSQHRLAQPEASQPAEPPRAQPEASQPAEPVRMTPAQERALRYMQRQDRYMELLARNTHEL